MRALDDIDSVPALRSTLLENLFDIEDASCQTEALANEWRRVIALLKFGHLFCRSGMARFSIQFART